IERRMAWSGNLRFALFLFGVLQLWVTIYIHWFGLPLLVIPFGLFIYVSLIFERARRRFRHVQRALDWYALGLARLEDRWAGLGIPGMEFMDENHPYSGDLALFGSGSMFERLCDAQSRLARQ